MQRTAALITSLGFCCPYAFFRCYKRTGLIAARLGVTDRAIRYQKAAFRCGEMKCEKQLACQLAAIRRAGK